MALPKALRKLTPDSLRHSTALRSFALRAGLVPPRTMHTGGEAALLRELARDRKRAVEIGVYEGSSSLVLIKALPLDSELHLIDPFGSEGPWPGVMNPADEPATKKIVGKQAEKRGGPELHWHVCLSEHAAKGWTRPVDLVFIDGDHSQKGTRLDWELWSPHVEPGGVVAFHDAREGHSGGWGVEGPTVVVDELFRNGGAPGWEITAERDTIVAVRRLEGR
jgi:Methyltransferase domain